jgi:hypothetical protein
MSLTTADAQLIASEIAKSLKIAGVTGTGGKGSSTGPAPGSSGSSISDLTKSGQGLTAGFDTLKDVVGQAKIQYTNLSQVIQDNLNTWRDLSKVGASFSNDIVAMRAAAAGARLDVGEFAGVIKENSASMTGFGGDVSKGAENFAKASKRMFDELGPVTDQLRQMGYTNKDLNDILALTNVSSRAKFADDDSRSKALTENATALAREMDLMAKLTGKTREEQMAQMRKNNADMAFEASLRAKMMEIDDPAKRAEFEKNARAQLAEAQNRGQGQMFKEVFATGQILSKEAAQQASLMGEQSRNTMRAAQVSANTQMDSAEREKQATDAQIAARSAFNNDMQNKQVLLMASMGDTSGAVGKTFRDSMSAQMDYQRGLEGIAAANKLDLSDKAQLAKAQQLYREQAEKGQQGVKDNGEQTNAATKAIINLGARTADVESAFFNKLVVPLNEKVNPALTKLADGALGATKVGTQETFVQGIEKQLEKGFSKANDAAGPIAGLGKAASTAADALLKIAGIQPAPGGQPAAQAPRRNTGSLGATGKLFENFGEGTLVELHGMESVMRPDDLKKVVQSSMSGMTSMMSKMSGSDDLKKVVQSSMSSMTDMPSMMSKMSKPDLVSGGGFSGGINFSEISKNISTTISGGLSSIKLDSAAIADMTKPFEKSFKDFNSNFGTLTKDSAKKLADIPLPYDEFAGLDEAIAKQIPYDEFAGLDDFIAKQLPFDEFAGLDEAIAKQMPFDEFSGLDEAIAKQMSDSEFGDLEGAMAKVAQDVDTEFGDLAGAIKAASERMYPDTEFGDLEGAMAKVAQDVDTEFGDLEGAMARVAQDVDTEFGDLAGAMKRATEDMYPDTEFGDLEGAMAKVQQDVDTEFGDLEGAMKYAQSQPYDEFGDLDGAIAAQQASQPHDEFGDLDGAIARQSAMEDLVSSSSPTVAQQPGRNIDINSFTLSPNGMPIPKPKSTVSAAPTRTAAAAQPAMTAADQEDADMGAAMRANASRSSTAGAAAGGKDSKNTLDDVVNALTALNSRVAQLITTSEQGYAAIARSAKAGSNNLYERAKA